MSANNQNEQAVSFFAVKIIEFISFFGSNMLTTKERKIERKRKRKKKKMQNRYKKSEKLGQKFQPSPYIVPSGSSKDLRTEREARVVF